MTVGYVGLGAMGRALAKHLIGKFDLLVWDINAAALIDAEMQGARRAASLSDIGSTCDVVFLCLPKSSFVEETLFGAEGLADRLAPRAIIVDQTSGVPGESRAFAERLHARGIEFIDAPVAGGVPAAHAGQITVMASGPIEVYERVLPILSSMSPKVLRCGDRVGDGQTVKAINNMINSAYRMATLEILAVGCKLGLAASAITDALNAGEGRSFVTSRLLPSIVERRASSDFALSLMVKDLNQAAELAYSTATPMPISDTARGMMTVALNTLGPHARLDDIVAFMEKATGTEFVPAFPHDDNPVEPHRAMQILTMVTAVSNRAIAVENTLMAVRAGLELDRFAAAISAGSASSEQAARLFASVARTGEIAAAPSLEELATLTEFAGIAAGIDVPVILINQVRAALLAAAHSLT